MAEITMTSRVMLVTKSTSEWESVTANIVKGVPCVELTTDGRALLKVGDGTQPYSSLPYVGEVDLSDYSTTTEMNTAIQTAADAALASAKEYTDSKVSSVYRYKGSVASEADLPTSDLTVGDVYNLEDTGMNVAWTGEAWDELGTTVDLSPYAKTADLAAVATSGAYSDLSGTPTAATTSEAGLMSAADKAKLDTIAEGATAVTVDAELSSSSTNPVQNAVVTAALDGKVNTTDTLILNCTL